MSGQLIGKYHVQSESQKLFTYVLQEQTKQKVKFYHRTDSADCRNVSLHCHCCIYSSQWIKGYISKWNWPPMLLFKWSVLLLVQSPETPEDGSCKRLEFFSTTRSASLCPINNHWGKKRKLTFQCHRQDAHLSPGLTLIHDVCEMPRASQVTLMELSKGPFWRVTHKPRCNQK